MTSMQESKRTALSWSAQIIAAGILAQTLFFKFTASPESVYIFSTLGMEPWGRIASGIAELVCVVMLLTPRLAALGAVASLAVISGALMSHLTLDGAGIFSVDGFWFVC